MTDEAITVVFGVASRAVCPGCGESPLLTPVGAETPLDPKELQVLTYVAAGATDEATARALRISPEQARYRIRKALEALEAPSRAAAVAVCFGSGTIKGFCPCTQVINAPRVNYPCPTADSAVAGGDFL